MIGVEHAVGDLERVADHAKNMAKGVISSPERITSRHETKRFEELTETVVQSWHRAVSAMAQRHAVSARRAVQLDTRIDARNDAIVESVMIELQKPAKNANWLAQQSFIARAMERIGDHATDLAEDALFLTRGVPPGATRAGRD